MDESPGISQYQREWLVEYLNSPSCHNVVVLTGAGISAAAGVPDFRSPGTGLYSQLDEYDLEQPEDLFSIDYFRDHPQPFYSFSKELLPEQLIPTTVHLFIKLLEQKRLLLRNITQNIDGLELSAGLSPDKVVFAHGSLSSAHCIRCKAVFPTDLMNTALRAGTVTHCLNGSCRGLVKPDVVFFGEPLPRSFERATKRDLPAAQILIVLGTSLKVLPFAALPSLVGRKVPRVLINREDITMMNPADNHSDRYYQRRGEGHPRTAVSRDVFLPGDCQDSIEQLIEDLGWGKDLELLRQQLYGVDQDPVTRGMMDYYTDDEIMCV